MSEPVMVLPSEEDYWKFPALSQSALKLFSKSPLRYKMLVDGLWSYGESESMLLGTIVDKMCFDTEGAKNYCAIPDEIEPPTSPQQIAFSRDVATGCTMLDAYTNHYAAKKNMDVEASKLGMKLEHYISFLRESAGKRVVSQTLFGRAKRSYNSLVESPEAIPLLWEMKGRNQVPIVFEMNGRTCKALIDRIVRGLNGEIYIVDLKTTGDSIDQFADRNYFNWGYDIQHAFYGAAVKSMIDNGKVQGEWANVKFINVVVESNLPHEVRVFEIEPAVIEAALADISMLMERLKIHEGANLWRYPLHAVNDEGRLPIVHRPKYLQR